MKLSLILPSLDIRFFTVILLVMGLSSPGQAEITSLDTGNIDDILRPNHTRIFWRETPGHCSSNSLNETMRRPTTCPYKRSHVPGVSPYKIRVWFGL